MSFYQYPEVYDALLRPEVDGVDDVLQWIEEYLAWPLEAVMDPCCGPGSRLLPFARRGCRVAGNDRVPEMVAEARRRVAEAGFADRAELVEGDMRNLLFRTSPFDVAINLDGSVGHLPDNDSVAEHLRSVRSHLRDGGLYFVGLSVFDGDAVDDEPVVIFETEPIAVASGGKARVRYESVWRDPVKCRERVDVRVVTEGVAGCPARLEESHELLTFRAEALGQLVKDAGFHLVAVREMEVWERPECDLYPGCGVVTLVLARLASSPG